MYWMRALGIALGCGWIAAASAPVRAQDDPQANPQPLPALPQVTRDWDASLGFVTSFGPEYPGAERQRLRASPGFYVRWGRISLATRGSFVSRSPETGARGGMRIDLSPSEDWRASLGLRYDGGRSESSSADLQGMGDIPSTLRVRFSTTYSLPERWRIGGGITFDAFGRGGGWQGNVGVGREYRLTPDTSAGFNLSLGFAGDRYMQSYYGVTPEQSAATGGRYPVYEPAAGATDLGFGVSGRTTLTRDWFWFYGSSVTRLLGPAAASPLTHQRNGWNLSAGLAYRF